MALINASEVTFPSSINTSVPNSGAFSVAQSTVTTAGTPVNAASLSVPADSGISIQNSPLNSSAAIIYIANSSANALDPTKRISLTRSQSIQLHITNANQLWFDSSVSGSKVMLLVEA